MIKKLEEKLDKIISLLEEIRDARQFNSSGQSLPDTPYHYYTPINSIDCVGCSGRALGYCEHCNKFKRGL